MSVCPDCGKGPHECKCEYSLACDDTSCPLCYYQPGDPEYDTTPDVMIECHKCQKLVPIDEGTTPNWKKTDSGEYFFYCDGCYDE